MAAESPVCKARPGSPPQLFGMELVKAKRQY